MTAPIDRADDDEGNIRDDPLLAALDRELNGALGFTDNRLLVFIGIALAAVYLMNRPHLPAVLTVALEVLAATMLFGGTAFTIFSAVWRQQRVAARYGLVCAQCGRGPRTTHILAAAELRQCDRCGHPLDVRRPAPVRRRRIS